MNDVKERSSVSRHQFGCWAGWPKLVAVAVPASDVLAREEFQIWSTNRVLDHPMRIGRFLAVVP
jgi:hypothetical protein